jgi:hypothetical protein
MGSIYPLAVVALCAAGFAWVLWCGVRDVGRALRTGRIRIRGRGAIEYDRRASPVGFWVTLLTAVWFFLFLAAFLAGVPAVILWLAHTHPG